ncbi:hypothetical protein DL93DRAFT_2227507 [Clavulina sp. PMI_390]|nr:hypothetical protein DL93DRAFT_2227507 [Clavulina sp. PMI_390]
MGSHYDAADDGFTGHPEQLSPLQGDRHKLQAAREVLSASSSSRSRSPESHAHSSILRLPFEILSEISLLVMLPLDASIWRSPLLAVNSWWRACVINTPQIWSCIQVFDDLHAEERLACWLHRSGGCPLYVTVRGAGLSLSLEKLWVDGYQHPGRRVQHLSIHHEYLDQPFPFPIPFETPGLRGLDAAFCYIADYHHGRSFALLGPNSSAHLETLRVRNNFFSHGAIDATGLGVSSLRSLVVEEELTRADILNILQHASNLKHLKWDISQSQHLEQEEGIPPGARELVLQSMQHLELSLGRARSDFFHVIRVPNLRILSLGGSWEPDELCSLIASVSECLEITHVRILSDGDHKPSEDGVALLCRSLRKLEYIDPGWGDDNVGALHALSGPQPTPKSRAQREFSSPVEAGRRVCLPLKAPLDSGQLSRERLSISLKKLLATIKPQRNAVKAAARPVALKSTDVNLPSPNYFVVVVDVDNETMVSMAQH